MKLILNSKCRWQIKHWDGTPRKGWLVCNPDLGVGGETRICVCVARGGLMLLGISCRKVSGTLLTFCTGLALWFICYITSLILNVQFTGYQLITCHYYIYKLFHPDYGLN